MTSYVSVMEAAKIKRVTRQAIYLAIRLKKLKAYRNGDKWKIFKLDLDEYDIKRWSRDGVEIDGELVFDESRGHVSIDRAAQMVNVPRQKIYYAVRAGLLKARRKKTFWVIKVDDLIKYQDNYLKRNLRRSAVG